MSCWKIVSLKAKKSSSLTSEWYDATIHARQCVSSAGEAMIIRSNAGASAWGTLRNVATYGCGTRYEYSTSAPSPEVGVAAGCQNQQFVASTPRSVTFTS